MYINILLNEMMGKIMTLENVIRLSCNKFMDKKKSYRAGDFHFWI